MDPIIETGPDGEIDVTYFLYDPSKPAAWAFVVLFAATTVTHFILMFPFRSAFFIPLIIGGISKSRTTLQAKESALLTIEFFSGSLRLLRSGVGERRTR